jgi:hypothetical protein
MNPLQMQRGIIYIATSPLCDQAIIGHGYRIESIKKSLNNSKSPARSTYSAGNLIRANGGIDAWNWMIISDKHYDNKRKLFKDFKDKYDLILRSYEWEELDYINCSPVNHELVELKF